MGKEGWGAQGQIHRGKLSPLFPVVARSVFTHALFWYVLNFVLKEMTTFYKSLSEKDPLENLRVRRAGK